MFRVAFTGPSRLPNSVSPTGLRLSAIPILDRWDCADEFISGAAYGVDTVLAKAAIERYPDKKHRVIIPAAHYNTYWSQSFILDKNIHIDWMPHGTDYMDRNQVMVDLADHLIAFPRTSNEELRSGTWATIRRARNKGIPIEIIPLDSL